MRNYKLISLYRQNRFTKRARSAKRRASALGAVGTFTKTTIQNLYVKQRGKCANCLIYLYGKFEADHIMPLSKGGNNSPENIQLLCPKCNKTKGAKWII